MGRVQWRQLLLTLSLFILPCSAEQQDDGDKIPDNGQDEVSRKLTFGMVSGDSEFFDPVKVGWFSECEKRNITCHYLPVNYTYFFEHEADQYVHPCVPLMLDLIEMGVDGISAACQFDDVTPWKKAYDAGIPLVAFDTKPPEGFPVALDAYVGTDQFFMGVTMASLLKQLKPVGGNFSIITTPSFVDREEGFRHEIFRDNDREDRAHWEEVVMPFPVYDQETDTNNFPWFMDEVAKKNPTALIFMYQTPMRAENYTAFVEKHRHRQIIYIGTDGSEYQLEYLERRFVDGLVGQLPYDMGSFSVDVLHKAITKKHLSGSRNDEAKEDHTSNEIILDAPIIPYVPTNLVAYNLIPVVLPTLVVDENLLGSLVYVGYTLFGIIAVASLLCTGWTMWNRAGTVVRASQPIFLIMTAFGILLMASAIIPFSFDDHNESEPLPESFAVGICMSIPWLAFIGFTCTFGALFSKTWRVNKFFRSRSAFGRLNVSELDVIAPFLILLFLNSIVLICWTLIDPLTYERNFLLGLDYWNREIASVGRCQSDHALAYLLPLAACKCVGYPYIARDENKLQFIFPLTLDYNPSCRTPVNFICLVIAAWQAWHARDIESEFSEAKYIGLSIFSMCQAFLTGIPIVAIVKDIPRAFYLVSVFLIFILCLVVLLLIFLPKIITQHKYSQMTELEQRRMLTVSVRKSAGQSSEFSSRGISGLDTPIGSGNSGNAQRGSEHLRDSGNLARSGPRHVQSTRRLSKKLEHSVQGFLQSGQMKLPSSLSSPNPSTENRSSSESQHNDGVAVDSLASGSNEVLGATIPEEDPFHSSSRSNEIVFVKEDNSVGSSDNEAIRGDNAAIPSCER